MSTALHVLHVDDNTFDCQLVRDALEVESGQFAVTTATSREEFEVQLAAGGFDLVLTDFNILGFEGLQVIDAVHQQHPSVPVIVITGTGSEEIAVEAMKRGAADYVIKTHRHIQRLPLAIQTAIERQRLRDERVRSEEILHAVVSDTPVILFALDVNGILTLLEGQGLEEFGVQQNAFVGHQLFEVQAGIFADLRAHFELALSGQESDWVYTIDDRVLDIHCSPLRNKVGEVSGVVGVAADITERLQAERLRIELDKEREIIDLKERFIAMVSHDFRTPLTVISMASGLLATRYDMLTAEQRAGQIQYIRNQVKYMTELLDRVLIFSKAQAGKIVMVPIPLDVAGFCRGIFEQFQLVDQAKHTFHFRSEGDLNMIPMDEALLRQILLNLLSNALKYSPQGGEVGLEVARQPDTVTFRISDQGIGIPPAEKERLFEPFHRAKNAAQIGGTGLGMSIVKSTVDAYGGTVTVESQEDVGTTFVVRLPIGV